MSQDDRCAGRAVVRCVLTAPHEGSECIYGKPGEPMDRLTPLAHPSGYRGAVRHHYANGTAMLTWKCSHLHSSVEGALDCAAGQSRRCPRCEGCLGDEGRCEGNQILGPCGYRLPASIGDITWSREQDDAHKAMMERLNALLADWIGDEAPKTELDELLASCAQQLARAINGEGD